MATILLVDDTAANILVFKELLAKEDRLFLAATNGKDALKIAHEQDIDLIILDVQMPGMDGFEVAQILKSNSKTRDMPIIFASAVKKEQKFILKGFEEGAIDYLFKPLDPEVTKGKVSVLLKVQEQKKELLAKNASLEEAQEQITALNNELTDNLQKLQELNTDMESFSYSVSHDLKAPLRSLLGYSEILFDDYTNTLDEDGKRLIEKVRSAGLRMERLIDDLLLFSKMGRKDLVRSEVDMDQLIKEVADEIQGSAPHTAELIIHPLPPISGDESLLHQVWINLLGNAIKYSSKKSNARIEIEGHMEDKHILFSIKDNGAGFDMKYAEKLFGVFQRLHSTRDFEGSGIGLATVQRIIKKHGGKIWAEAKEDEGATFYFSLPMYL